MYSSGSYNRLIKLAQRFAELDKNGIV